MKIAVVVQRYGLEVAGGAELHARYVAELLAERHDVTVLTTTARDYVTWEEHYPAGPGTVGGLDVHRFPVTKRRNLLTFAAAQATAFQPEHHIDDEVAYLEEQGPLTQGLPEHFKENPERYDAVVAFSFRYLTTQVAISHCGPRTILVPTAEEDPAVGLETSKQAFRSVAALAYNSHEERELIHTAAGNEDVPGDIVGIFSRIPDAPPSPERFRERYDVSGAYLLYVGRIDRNKGCVEMFDEFAAWSAETALPHRLLLIGAPVIDIPDHPMIRHLGFTSDEDKFDALAGADALLMPSTYESLSMVTLEAMALGVPPLCNGRCAVLKGQMRRSNAGLYYESYDELFEALTLLVQTPELRRRLGANGRRYYQTNYAPKVIAEKFEALLRHTSGAERHSTE